MLVKNWMRMVNSAQRVITFESPRTIQTPGLEKCTFDIQGVMVTIGGHSESVTYDAMAAYGIRRGWAKALSFMQRLRREQTPIGWLRDRGETEIEVHLWLPSPVTLIFDLEMASEGTNWREMEIMAMSAGFHFKPHPEQN